MFNNFRNCYLNAETTKMVADQMDHLLQFIGQDIANIAHLIDADIDAEFIKWSANMRGILFTAIVEKNRWATGEAFDTVRFNEFNKAFCDQFIEIAKCTHLTEFEPNIFSSNKEISNTFRGYLEQSGIVFKSYVRDYQSFDNRVEYAYENTKSIDRMVNTLIVLIETMSSMFESANRSSAKISDNIRAMLYQIKEAVDSSMAKFAILLGGEFLKEYTRKMTSDTFFVNNVRQDSYSIMRYNMAFMQPPSIYPFSERNKFEQQLWDSIQGVLNA